MPTRDAAPHVFLIGWTGCTQRHLQKYADIWASEGVTKTTLVLEHCAMGISERWRREKFDAVAADVLAQMASAAAPIIVHVFSNGGGHVWAALGRRDDRNVQIVGLVADSAPGYLNSPTTAFNFFWETQRSKFARGGLMLVAAVVPASAIALVVAISRLQPLLRLVAALPIVLLVLFADWWSGRKQRDYFDDFLRPVRSRRGLPVRFLYSRSDALISYRAVEEVCREAAAAGAFVGRRCWKSSPHVQHARTHPKEYGEELSLLLQHVKNRQVGE